MHSGGVSTLMLALFNLVKILFSANLYKNCTASVLHQPVKPKVLASTQQQSFGMMVYALALVCVTVCC